MLAEYYILKPKSNVFFKMYRSQDDCSCVVCFSFPKTN